MNNTNSNSMGSGRDALDDGLLEIKSTLAMTQRRCNDLHQQATSYFKNSLDLDVNSVCASIQTVIESVEELRKRVQQLN